MCSAAAHVEQLYLSPVQPECCNTSELTVCVQLKYLSWALYDRTADGFHCKRPGGTINIPKQQQASLTDGLYNDLKWAGEQRITHTGLVFRRCDCILIVTVEVYNLYGQFVQDKR